MRQTNWRAAIDNKVADVGDFEFLSIAFEMKRRHPR